MPTHYTDPRVTLHHDDCLNALRELPDNSVDAVVTDPPYSLNFMSAKWDNHDTPLAFQQWCQEWAAECLRVLKPGGHMLAFGGTRTFHRLACAIEDAGFEIRDSIGYGHMTNAGTPVNGGDATESSPALLAWIYGSGFP